MIQRTGSSRRASALALLAAVLIAGSAGAGIASYFFLTASGSSAQNSLPAVAQRIQSAAGNAGANLVSDINKSCLQVPPADGSDPEVPSFSCRSAAQPGASQTQPLGAQARAASDAVPQANPTLTVCQTVGVDQGDSEYGPLPILSCHTTVVEGDIAS